MGVQRRLVVKVRYMSGSTKTMNLSIAGVVLL